MINFKDIVASVSSGRLAPDRVGYYIKRLAAETATRRIASIFIIGLLLFQIFTLLAPPKPTYASSPFDLISGAPFNKDSLISAVWDQNRDGIQQVFGRLGISREKMQAAGVSVCGPNGGGAREGDNWISMGRSQDGANTSVEWQPNIWVGSSVHRWGTPNANDGICFNVLMGGTDPSQIVHVTDGGPGIPEGWYQWGVILECGNIILLPVPPPPPPKEISCASLNYTVPGPIAAGSEIGYRGYANGQNVDPGELVDMAYGVYKDGQLVTDSQVSPPLQSASGVGQKSPGVFEDGTLRVFKFNQPGNYQIRLVVFFDVNGVKYFASGSGTGECSRDVQVQAPKTLVCGGLDMANQNNNFTFQAPFTPFIKGTALQEGQIGPDVFARKFEYLYLKEVPAGTAGPTYTQNGKTYQEAKSRIIHTFPTQNTLVDPLANSQNPAGFSATQFETTAPGSYLILLRVYDSVNGNPAPDRPSCGVPFVVTPQPKDITCVSLTGTPTTSDTVPVDVNFTARGGALNTTIKEYQFDFGDGGKQTVTSGALEIKDIKHTYQNGGSYTAKVTVVGADGSVTSSKPTCTLPLKFEQHVFRKTVKNLTILTSDGKPTDANGATARAGDKLTYTIGLANIGTAPIKGYIFKDDISDIIMYADVIDKGGAELKVEATRTSLVWPAVDIPVSTNPNDPTYITKSFTVQVKDPIPTTAQKPTDNQNYDCQMEDRFEGNVVVTPISVNPAKRLDCTAAQLPRTGAAASLIVMGLLAAMSIFLLLKNRLMKRELDLLETLNEGGGK